MRARQSLTGLVVLLCVGCSQGVPNPRPEGSAAGAATSAPTSSSARTTTGSVSTASLAAVMAHARVSDVGDPSGAELEMIELANRARRDPIAEGARYGLNFSGIPPVPPLAPNALLAKAALAHATDQAVNKYYDHQNPKGGPDIEQQVENAGYAADGNSQNIDVGPVGLVDAKEEHKRFIVDEGVNPPGHRWNILSYAPPGQQTIVLREMGTSYIADQVTKVGAPWDQYIVQNFGSTETNKPFVCGVVFADTNNSGEYDAGEGLKDVVVRLRGMNGVVISTATRTAGAYSFEIFTPGEYTVEMQGGPFTTAVSLKVRVDSVNVKVDGVAGKGLIAR